MASFGGVVVTDPVLANKFTQAELRSLMSQFNLLKSKDGLITAEELQSGINKLNLFQQPLTKEEIVGIMKQQGSYLQDGLSFESFLKLYLDLQKCGNPKISPEKKSSAFLKLATTTLLHHISESEKKAYVDHINTYLEDDIALSTVLPIDSSSDAIFDIVKDGVLLCKLINVAVPGTIDERALNIKEKLNVWERVENHNLCLNSAKAIGCSVVNIGTQDLMEGRPHLVLGLISQIVKIQLLANVNLKETPELVEMVNDTEEIEELLNLPADKVLLRWMNYHLKKAGFTKVISNFSSDIKDGEAYTVLLHTLAPQSCELTPLEVKDPFERAKAVLVQADQIGCRKYVSPKDIVDGSTNLNLAFVANLFHERNGLTVDFTAISFAEMLKDDEQTSREERAFRIWINSLGISVYVNNLFEDLRDGWVLLEVLDKVVPGIVDWKIANRPPIKLLLRKVENCNQVISIGRKLKLSVVNIAGNDIVQGNRKLLLAFLWQLMRYNMLHLLRTIKYKGKEVSDADILEWANNKVKASGRKSRMESFKDKSLSSGLFFLDLLAAVEPRVVNWQLVTKGETDEEKKQNAEYVISVARKLGCSVFLLWDDIVEVRHKMILILMASIMLGSLAKRWNKAAAAAAALNSSAENGNEESSS